MKGLIQFFVKTTVHRQDFGAKFNFTYHNGTPVADIPKRFSTVTLQDIITLGVSDKCCNKLENFSKWAKL